MDCTNICIAVVSEKSGVFVWISFVFWCLVGTSYRCLSLLRFPRFVLSLHFSFFSSFYLTLTPSHSLSISFLSHFLQWFAYSSDF